MSTSIAARADGFAHSSRFFRPGVALAGPGRRLAQAEFAKALRPSADKTRQNWREFFPELVGKHCQGFLNSPDKMARKVGYPEEWLKRTNYYTGPISYEKIKPETPAKAKSEASEAGK